MTLADGRDQLRTRMQEQMNYSGLYNGNIAWMSTDLAHAGEMKDDRAKGLLSGWVGNKKCSYKMTKCKTGA